MNVPTLPPIVFAIALGQMCAIGLHAWTWRLRQREIWSLALIGVLGASLFFLVLVLGFAAIIGDFGNADDPSSFGEKLLPIGAVLASGVTPLAIGFLHACQLQGHWKPTRAGWGNATLSVFGELSIAALLLEGVAVSNSMVGVMDVNSTILFSAAFIGTLLVLMIFRPLVLKFLRPFAPLFQNLREKLRLLHPKVKGDVS